MVAYAVWLLALVHAARLWRLQAPGWQSASLLAVLLTAQAATGIWTLLMVVPLELGLLHQFGAALVWIAAIAHLHGFYRTDLTAPRAAA
jgi:cytochrome c oxidase assembly protein subunit 15